jgi:nucleoid-associated protein YgaU
MSGPRGRLAALILAFAVAPGVAGGCIPPPVALATPSPPADTDPPATAVPTPAPTGPTPPPSFVRPTPTPLPTFLSYVVERGDTLDSIARAHGTSARSLAFWNRTAYPSLDPDSATYDPNRIKVGWVLLLVPDTEIDEDETFP